MVERLVVSARNKNQIQEVAFNWRGVFGLGNSKNFDMVKLLVKDLPEFISEFSFKVASENEPDISEEGLTTFEPPQIQLRRDVFELLKQGDPRARFTAAHELGHLVLHKAFPEAALARTNVYNLDGKPVETIRDAEWQANNFATQFLMPEDLVRDYTSAEDIKLDFSVSQIAAERRLEEITLKKPRKIPEHVKEIINQFKRDNGFPELK